MPAEYLKCVANLIAKGKSKKDAQRICAIAYFKRHGRTPQQDESASNTFSETPDLYYAIGLPPEKAVEYFRRKGYTFSWDWHEVWQEAHARAFTVAKAMRLDILQDIREMLQKALDEGITLREFRNQLEPRLKARGWWGRVRAADVPGYDPASGIPPDEPVQLGSPWRLKTIYHTNMQTAYMAGRYRAQRENTKDRPYWQYVAVLDSRTRPSHRALHGKVFRWDDPFWDAFYPPNGWGCRCRVRALSKRDLERRGLTVESGAGQLSTEERIISQKTGETRPVTVYTDPVTGEKIAPDPGWSYNPGKNWGLWDANGGLPDCTDLSFFEKVISFTQGKSKCVKILPGQKTWEDYGRPDVRRLPDKYFLEAPELLKAGKTEEDAFRILSSALGLEKENIRIITGKIGEKVIIKKDLLYHIIEKRDAARERYVNFLLPTLLDPFEIYLTEYGDGFRQRYIGLFKGKNNIMVIVRINQDGSFLWNMMHTDNRRINKQRIGTLLFYK